jgi:FKBP-type peptidyl-prolyl cis-trans isomerase FklB
MNNSINADVSYCIGLNIAENLKSQNLGNLDVESFLEGVKVLLNNGQPKFSIEQVNQILNAYFEQKSSEEFAEFRLQGEAFLKENAQKEGVNVTDSGLQYEVINLGTGVKPETSSVVSVHYHGTLIDGTVFDSSYERGTPAQFPLNQVIAGWTEGLQLMNEGSKFRFYIPQELAYGANPHPQGPIKPYMALVFDVELLTVEA